MGLEHRAARPVRSSAATPAAPANPDPSELRKAEVEPICKKYLELRYRLMPYMYSGRARVHETGLPIMRALWLHHPDDPRRWRAAISICGVATSRVAGGREGSDAAGAVSAARHWFDFWTEERVEGGREIERAVDLATMPLYVRAGAIVPLGPVKEYAERAGRRAAELVDLPGRGRPVRSLRR